MPLATQTYAYRITLQIIHRISGKSEEYTHAVVAYSLSDAVAQASYKVGAECGIDWESYRIQVQSVEPDFEAVLREVAAQIASAGEKVRRR